MLLRERVALDEREFQARLREAAPGMLPVPRPAGPRSQPAPPQDSFTRLKTPIKLKCQDVLDLFEAGKHTKEIAVVCEMRVRDVRRQIEQARARGDPRAARRKTPIRLCADAFFIELPQSAHRKIREAALRRGLDEAELTCRLVEILAHDNLIDAILDDET
jgi:DNA-binding CsgD family transcriptional regulator